MTTEPLSHQIVDRLLTPTEPWLSCDDCFDDQDVAIDALLESGTPLGEPFRVHLDACPACLEETRSLATLVAGDHGLDPEVALVRLDAALRDPDA